ncbi:hypothetical protein RDABS01_010762, partial [Bienertia sinuspersici]
LPRTTWTQVNPRTKFVACKFYKHEARQRGCNYFEWVDKDMVGWQRDVINAVVAEKRRLATDISLLKNRRVCLEHEKNKLAEQ